MPSLTVIIPALNEEGSIAGVIRTIPPGLADDVIVVDNGSSDSTAREARSAGARVIVEPRRGYGRACAAGVAALRETCTIVVFLDGDGSDVPQVMNELVEPVAAGDVDFLIGSRTRGQRERGSMSALQLAAGRIAGVATYLLCRAAYSDMCPYRAISRRLLDRLPMTEMTYGWNLQMQVLVARSGARIREIPVPHRRRSAGESKVSGNLRAVPVAAVRIIGVLLRCAFPVRRRRANPAYNRDSQSS